MNIHKLLNEIAATEAKQKQKKEQDGIPSMIEKGVKKAEEIATTTVGLMKGMPFPISSIAAGYEDLAKSMTPPAVEKKQEDQSYEARVARGDVPSIGADDRSRFEKAGARLQALGMEKERLKSRADYGQNPDGSNAGLAPSKSEYEALTKQDIEAWKEYNEAEKEATAQGYDPSDLKRYREDISRVNAGPFETSRMVSGLGSAAEYALMMGAGALAGAASDKFSIPGIPKLKPQTPIQRLARAIEKEPMLQTMHDPATGRLTTEFGVNPERSATKTPVRRGSADVGYPSAVSPQNFNYKTGREKPPADNKLQINLQGLPTEKVQEFINKLKQKTELGSPEPFGISPSWGRKLMEQFVKAPSMRPPPVRPPMPVRPPIRTPIRTPVAPPAPVVPPAPIKPPAPASPPIVPPPPTEPPTKPAEPEPKKPSTPPPSEPTRTPTTPGRPPEFSPIPKKPFKLPKFIPDYVPSEPSKPEPEIVPPSKLPSKEPSKKPLSEPMKEPGESPVSDTGFSLFDLTKMDLSSLLKPATNLLSKVSPAAATAVGVGTAVATALRRASPRRSTARATRTLPRPDLNPSESEYTPMARQKTEFDSINPIYIGIRSNLLKPKGESSQQSFVDRADLAGYYSDLQFGARGTPRDPRISGGRL